MVFIYVISTNSNLIFKIHCVKIVQERSFCGPYFPAFGLNTEIYGVNIRIQSKYWKIRTRKTPYLDTFYTVIT